MEKHYVVAYLGSMEEEVMEKLNCLGQVAGKYEHSHCVHFTTKEPKTRISALTGVLYVEEEK